MNSNPPGGGGGRGGGGNDGDFYDLPAARPVRRISHPLLYARIPRNRHKVRQFGVLFSIPQLTFAGNHIVKE